MAPLIARQGGEVGGLLLWSWSPLLQDRRRGVRVDEPKHKDHPPSLTVSWVVLLSPSPFLVVGHRAPVSRFLGP